MVSDPFCSRFILLTLIKNVTWCWTKQPGRVRRDLSSILKFKIGRLPSADGEIFPSGCLRERGSLLFIFLWIELRLEEWSTCQLWIGEDICCYKIIRAGNRDSCRSPRELQRKIVTIKLARVATLPRSLNKQPHLLTHKLSCRTQ